MIITNKDPKNKSRTNNTLEILRSLEENQFSETYNREHLPFFRERSWAVKPQENLIFSQKEKEVQQKIDQILTELAKLAKTVNETLTTEIKNVVQTPIVAPGVYHLNFFEKIRETLVLLSKKIEHAATWVAEGNKRGKKMGYYHSQVKKSGTKFMLSQERTTATQTG
jgi:hypothetical protein